VHLDGALAARAARLPGILFLHEEMPQAFGRMLRNSAVAIADASVAVSRAVAAGVAPPLRRRVTVIPNGVDASQITPGLPDPGVRSSLGAGEGDVLLLALTRLDPEKRIEDLLTAVQPLKDRPGWHLAIAGVTSSYPEYAAWVQELAQRDLPGRVTFAGRREDVPLLLRSADLLVHAGVVEGMPLGLLEAQASALPVVAYRVAGVPEAVQHGVTGLLANPRDAAELGRHIARLVAAQTLRLQFGAAGRKHVERTHTLERQADAYARLLHHLRVACVAPLATTAS
jgi:glycosyltransferase involved in cell wall biosynthesis